MEIYLLRHGQTAWNTEKRLQGSTDVELDDVGVIQASDAAIELANTGFDRIYTSPLKRAYETARIIASLQSTDIEPIVDDRLKEMCFGKLEGMVPEDASEYPMRKILFKDPANYIPDEEGESFEDVHKRSLSFLDDMIIDSLDDSENAYNRVLIVAHGAIIKALERAMKDAPVSEFWSTPPALNCKSVIYSYDKGVYTQISEIDDTVKYF